MEACLPGMLISLVKGMDKERIRGITVIDSKVFIYNFVVS